MIKHIETKTFNISTIIHLDLTSVKALKRFKGTYFRWLEIL